ncbi:hypothetical protein DR64_7952 [Paraburkholderia xenovorans LB400]|nr:hypothetical protein DR64_7952 [Paraburkholderia xenovorans LB400]
MMIPLAAPDNRFVASLIGSSSMNFLQATVEGDGQLTRGQVSS